VRQGRTAFLGNQPKQERMKNYDHTLSMDTINLILRDLRKSPDIDKPGTRDHIRALQLLTEKKERDKKRTPGRQTALRYR
jgi:hypothetical protein